MRSDTVIVSPLALDEVLNLGVSQCPLLALSGHSARLMTGEDLSNKSRFSTKYRRGIAMVSWGREIGSLIILFEIGIVREAYHVQQRHQQGSF